MKILAINASPREGGNTDTLLDKFLEGASSLGAEFEKLYLTRLNISPCTEEEYENIREDGFPVVKDDMDIIFKAVKSSDCILLASPTYFGSLAGQMKIMIDRFQCVWLAKNLYKKDPFGNGKKGIFFCVQASDREDFFENSRSIVRHLFATLGVEYSGELYFSGLDKKDDASKRPEYLKKAFDLGRKLAKHQKTG